MSDILDIEKILGLIPHRYPFVLVDRIVEYERRKRVVGLKNVTMNEPFFPGHFPGRPVMPGVLIVEALAQTAGALIMLEVEDRENKLILFTGIDGCRFRRPVIPGDQLRLELTVDKLRPRAAKMSARATVEGELAVEATLLSAMVDK